MRKAVVLALVALLAAPAAAQATRRISTAEAWRKVTGGVRDYWLFTPKGRVPRTGRPLVVYLHGCTQNNDTDPQVAFGTRWNELAKQVGAVVLYPLQSAYDMEHPEAVEGNGGSCWNWFLDKNMHRGAGEPAMLAALTREIMASEHVDPSRVYVMGTSAGADMTNVLSITYPDLFKAAAMFAGCAYDACGDTTGTLASRELAAHGLRPVPAIVFQGDADMLNNLALGETLLHQQVGMHGFDHTPSSTEHHGDPTAVHPGEGFACVDPEYQGYPCAAGVTGWPSYPYTVDHYGGGVVDFWTIHGLNHDYPYGDTRSTFTDPAGPDVTRAAWEFFLAA
jgi:poly(hydroxyalkanoate) depolymerase family esterase